MRHHHRPDPYKALPLDERIRLAEQAVIDRDERVQRLGRHLTGQWHGKRMPSVATGAGAGLLAGLGTWIVRRAFASRPAIRRSRSGSTRLDLVLQFLPLLLPVLPVKLQRWVKPSRLMLGLTLAAPLFAAWQTRREKAQAEADERALIRQVLREQRAHYEALRERLPDPAVHADDPVPAPLDDDDDAALQALALQRTVAEHVSSASQTRQARHA